MGVFMGREVFSVTEQMRNLRKRAGFSVEEMAQALGYSHASSIQAYENEEDFHKDYFSREFTQKLANAIIGLGQPAIKPDEVWALSLPEARTRLLVKRQDAYNESVTVRLPPEMVTGQLAANIIDGIKEITGPANGALSDSKNANQDLNKNLEDLADGAPSGSVISPANFENGRLLPVYGKALRGKSGEFELDGNVVFDVSCPPQLYQSSDAYAVEVSGESMWPRYRHGELVYCDPGHQLKKGDFVVAQIIIDDDMAPQAFVTMFLDQNASELVLEQLNPPKKLVFPNDKVVSVDYITLSGDAL